MKKFFFIIILINLLIKPYNAFADINETIVIGGDNYFPPFEYVDENGVYKGFNVDIMRAIAIEMGIDVELKPMPWFQVILALNEKKIDAIQGMKYSKIRNYIYDFSEPYIVTSQAIFVHIDNKCIVDLQDLYGKKVAVQKNDIALDMLKNIQNIDIIETENQENALDRLLKGKVDAYVGNKLTGLYIIQKKGYAKNIKIVGEEINPQKYCFAVNKGDKKILEIFNEGLHRIKKNGTYDKIYKKWFGEMVYPTYRYIRKIICISIAVFLVLILFMLLFYRWNYILKKEVEKRTQQIREKSVFMEQIINSIFSGLITINKEGVILSANIKALLYLDCSKEALVNKYFYETKIKEYFHQDDFYEVLKTGEEKINIEKELNIKGKKRIFEYNVYPIINTKKEICSITLTFKDVTNEKIMQEKIIMKDKLESLGRLVAGIAHEIRNPLTAIKTYIQLIPYKYNNPDFRQKISEDVPTEIERLDSIIANLLEYAKPKKPNKELINVKDTIDSILRIFEKHIEDKGIKLYVDIKENVFINTDKQHFKQIIINLLLNSIQALENRKNAVIEIYAKNGDLFSEIFIKDNGCGISKEDMKRIFEPFFTTKNKGSGLGLALCYQLIKENGGDVFIDSEIGEGTEIKISLPKAFLFTQKN
ncbi:polar amino acid transport system substrate-binding protein [Caminicella sporogenes DSM 14501]|uniref:histidine kinase n=1 Tax=Caminicella sporogenes DSM 14501 TaxID=1121266 RepID=A0A1M6NWN7_9FIRM|nr:transporter substrate-binding domain-containing protein [Caminicella sporogenes]RKD21619.1 hypothetical protein BET04_07830 [Caminicella sporogenes]SHK00082.1 polar amino acid transport system substrate-binding protein [Caminicella sporogenes DSM 14501]